MRCVDGEPVEIDDLRGWPLIENPWAGQAYCGPTLTLVRGDQMVVYDFRQRTVTTTKSR